MKKLVLGAMLAITMMTSTTLVAQVLEVNSVTATTFHSLLNKESSIAMYILPFSSNPMASAATLTSNFLKHLGAQSVTQSGNTYTLTIAGDSRTLSCQNVAFGAQSSLTVTVVCFADEAIGTQAIAQLQQVVQNKCTNSVYSS